MCCRRLPTLQKLEPSLGLLSTLVLACRLGLVCTRVRLVGRKEGGKDGKSRPREGRRKEGERGRKERK